MKTIQEKRDLLLLLALQHAGVDNWSGYEIAQDLYEDMLKEHGLSEDDEDDEVEDQDDPEHVEERAPEPELRSALRLRNILADRYEDEHDATFKRNFAPKQYDRAMQTVKAQVEDEHVPAGQFLERVRNLYLDLLYGEGAGETEATRELSKTEDDAATENEPRSTRRLRKILGDRYDAEHKAVWQREYAPAAYDTSEAVLAWGTKEYSRNVYLDQVFGKGAGDD